MNKQDVMEIIEALAAKLGVASSQLLEWQMQTMVINWWAAVVVSFFVTVLCSPVAVWAAVKHAKADYGQGDGFASLTLICGLFGGLAFIFLIGHLVTIATVLAPEAAAVNQLIKLLR